MNGRLRMSPDWKLRHVVGEAIAHLGSATARTLLLGLVFTAGLGGVMWAELVVTGQLAAQADRLRARGGDVVVVALADGDSNNDLTAPDCDALNHNPGVIAAGALQLTGAPIQFATAPGTSFDLVNVTPPMVTIWDPSRRAPTGGGWVLGQAAAAELGVRDGSLLAETGQPGAPVTVINPVDRNSFGERTVLNVVPPRGVIVSCWVEFHPHTASGGRQALFSAFPGSEVDVRPVITVDGEFARDPRAELATRPQRQLWLPAGGIIALLGAIVALGRRPEAAVYRAFGLRRSGLLALHQTETILICLVAYLAAITWTTALYTALYGLPLTDQIAIAARTAGRTALVVMAVTPWLALLTGTRSPAALLKDR